MGWSPSRRSRDGEPWGSSKHPDQEIREPDRRDPGSKTREESLDNMWMSVPLASVARVSVDIKAPMQTESGSPKPPSRGPSSLACVPCRRRHLKCDAQMPVCGRCQASHTECHYVRSRRGLRNRTARDPPSQLLLNDDIAMFNADAFADWLNTTSLPDLDTDQTLLQSLGTPQTLDIPSLTDDALTWPEPSEKTCAPDVAYDSMIQLFYQNFHRSHPVLIPRRALQSPLREKIPPYLFAIMRYIGAHYYPDPLFREPFRPGAYEVLSDSTPKDGFKVQGLLLLAIIEHAQGQEGTAHLTMETAISLALDLGMNRASYAREHAGGDSLLEESWRRTYWELYVVDALLAAMRDQSMFRLCHQKTGVKLPCSEQMYNAGVHVIPNTRTLEDLQRHWAFGDDKQQPSSFAYRIEAARTLGRVMEVNRSLDMDVNEKVETLDAALFAAMMRLSSSQGAEIATTTTVYDSANLDEMAFQAEMITYLAMIYLHHPRSSMRFASFHARTSCTRLRAAREEPTPPVTDLDLHSQKFLRAADLLSNLATLPSPIKSRTPFFTCALAMCVVVHIAGCLVLPATDKQESLKARIQLGIGGLHVLGKVWPMARAVRQQMVDMYQEMGLR